MAALAKDITRNSGSRLVDVPVPPHLRLLALATVLSFGLALLPGHMGVFFAGLRWIAFASLIVAAGMHLFYLAQRGLLWRLRNKLVLTYLLIGLAPVVLFFLLVFAAAYVAAGQFAIHLATSRLEEQISSVAQDNRSIMRHARDLMATGDLPPSMRMPEVQERLDVNGPPGLQMAVFRDAQPVDVIGLVGHKRTPLGFEHWLATGPLGSFRAIVLDDKLLYLAVTDRTRLPNDHILTVISSVPLNRQRMDPVAQHLGRVDLLPGLETQTSTEDQGGGGDGPSNLLYKRTSNAALRQSRISGGSAPPAVNLFDIRVRFFSTLPVRDWETGHLRGVPLNVESRPSLLYHQLFAAALTGQSNDTVRFVFFAVCLLFAAMEGLALYAGLRLSSTITQSVEDLYAATLSIDRGDLHHRIKVERDDQLADLGRSFNRMSQSLGRLIEEQKEKERIESELSIAQEVQANLFPRASVSMPTLELHGICRPARIVSGDYYDFLPFERETHTPAGKRSATPTGLGIALGDISGKGISAALLMATLHSAVRAYRFASEELQAPSASDEPADCSELFESPSRILALLNRHLYRSTTPEKYATLFLAHYDLHASRLTYANAGQLPPFVLRADSSVVRLDRGGTVVGLIDNMVYDEESVQLYPGDILIAYSDGVTEPENDFGDFGEDRLIDVVRAFRDEPLDVISAEVMRALDAWIGEDEQPDDITLVLARQL